MVKKNAELATLLYHEVISDNELSGFQRRSALPYKHSRKEFNDNLAIIFNSPYTVKLIHEIDLDDKIRHLLLTFDDGGSSAMYIADQLDIYGFKGHFFISTNMMNNPYFLNGSEIKELQKRGHTIGSHSHTHPNVFKSQSYREMMEEWTLSKNILENLLGIEIDTCSIPGGDDNHNTYESARETGFRYIFNSNPGYKVYDEKGLVIISRICPKRGTSYKKIRNYSHFRKIYREKLLRKIKNTAKDIIFPIYSRIHNGRRHEE